MPYIKEERRVQLMSDVPETSGELNYLITRLITQYIETNGLSYQTLNDITGALTNAQAEFYRRVCVPYENMKAAQNGDVYRDIQIGW